MYPCFTGLQQWWSQAVMQFKLVTFWAVQQLPVVAFLSLRFLSQNIMPLLFWSFKKKKKIQVD